jgi:hypothetical protein
VAPGSDQLEEEAQVTPVEVPVGFLRGGGAALLLLSDGRHGYTCPSRSHLTRQEQARTWVAGLEYAMNGASLIHPMTSLAPRAERPWRGPRTTLRGGVLLMLAWMVLEGAFLLDVTRPAPGAGNRESSATIQPLAVVRSSPPP